MFKIIPRHPREAISVGDEIVIAILGVNGQQVRIGIEAPKDVPVHREEVAEAIRRDAVLSDGR